jgi:7-carboxy-7-deazaguanine synthase (Cx14CxxC type)
MPYQIKEIFYTLQGEGLHAGRPAVFCRFAGCNLWSGREEDRSTAVCRYCDTDFVGTNGPEGGSYASATELVRAVAARWPAHVGGVSPFVVCTGGEPLLQLDAPLIDAFHAAGLEVAIETNGTLPAPDGIDWICVSPKAEVELLLTSGDELKLIYPQEGVDPDRFAALDFEHFLLQPMDGPARDENTLLAKEYCLSHPPWRLSLQFHKILGLP